MEQPGTLAVWLDGVARRYGAREALVSTCRRIGYAELAADSLAIGRALAARGVGKGTRVGLLMPNWPEWIEVAFAVWRCGGLLVPLSTLYRPRELEYALRHADVSVLIAVRAFLRHDYQAVLEEIAPGLVHQRAPIRHPALPALREIVWVDRPESGAQVDRAPLLAGGERLDGEWPAPLTTAVSPADPATIFFTSGTTAEPKGVVHVHRALARAAEDIAGVLGIDEGDRTWGYLPFFFTGGLVAVGLASLARGAAVVMQEVFEAGETLDLLESERCSVFFAWPHQAEALLAHPRFAAARLHLRKGVGANTKWAPRLYAAGHHAVGTFGMTETGPVCTAWPWETPVALRSASHGPPAGAKEVRIVDPETGALLPANGEGEIHVRGPTLFSRYYRQRPGDCVDGEGFFHTGDLGRLDTDGALTFLGRIKDVIKSAGVNVAAAEVEAVLLAHPAVAAAHVVGVPDPLRGENVAAFVVPRSAVTADELTSHCRERLASYKVPRHFWFRDEPALPVKGSGKVDKPRLRAEAVALAGAERQGS